MSSDIVERLRSENRMAMAPFHMSDAADEIERLRGVAELGVRLLSEAAADLAAERAEVERLDSLLIRQNAVMSNDDIVVRLGHVTAGDEQCRCLKCEAAAEIQRLRAAGDALAKSLAEFNDPEDGLRLLAWQEARREQ